MRLRDHIIKHITIYKEYKNAKLPWELLSEHEEDIALELSRKINERVMGDLIKQLTKKAIDTLFHDMDAIEYVQRLFAEDISSESVSGILEGAAGERISEYAYTDVAAVAKDCSIYTNKMYPYLKYYLHYGLGEEEKERLMNALSMLDSNEGVTLSDLSEEQRKLLWEPVFSTKLLERVLDLPDFWVRLQNTDLLGLLNTLAGYWKYMGKRLSGNLFTQMAEHPKEIEQGLHDILSQIDPEDAVSFLSIWLDNEALLYDLNKLRIVISQKEKEDICQITQSEAGYFGAIYGEALAGIDLEHLTGNHEQLLIYAITKRKKHFIKLVKENFKSFLYVPFTSGLFDRDVYRHYLNINTLNVKDLEDCYQLKKMKEDAKEYMVKDGYTFSELKVLAPLKYTYVLLYHKLVLERSDDRLQTFREIVKKKCLPDELEETEAEQLGRMLSQKPLSKWMQDVFSHISDLRPANAILLLCYWDELQRFITDIENVHQAVFLLKNREALAGKRNFEEVRKEIIEIDCTWNWLKANLNIEDTFVQENQSGIRQFLLEGGGEIMFEFCKDQWGKREEAKRLLQAEILGRFHEVKYFGNDLEREIAFPVTEDVKQTWIENSMLLAKDMEAWEEDRLIPVMQIGEILGHTCLSYIDGEYKQCLLSSFDANKKILFLSIGGVIVFRAIIRLTKGSFSRIRENRYLNFIDVTSEPTNVNGERPVEYLTLFMERPYFKGVAGNREKEIITFAIQLLQQKAKKIGAILTLSNTYQGFGLEEKNFVRVQYYIYISKSKNGSQYCDSLGGEATVTRSGSYDKGYFLMEEKDVAKEKAS